MSVNTEDDNFYNWNDIEKQMKIIVGDLNLTVPLKKNETNNDLDTYFNYLMIDPGVDQPQQAQTDMLPAFELKKSENVLSSFAIRKLVAHLCVLVVVDPHPAQSPKH